MHRLASYFSEREGFESIVTDEGFATYRINGEECYIRDIWVHKDFRKKGVASEMADDIARIAITKGCKFLTGSVSVTDPNSTANTMVLLAYGFKIESVVNYGIVFRKGL